MFLKWFSFSSSWTPFCAPQYIPSWFPQLWKLWHSQHRISSKLWPRGTWDEYWIPPEQQRSKVLSTDTINYPAGKGTCQYRSHVIRSIQLILVLENPLMDEQKDEELKVSFKTSLHILQISTWLLFRVHSSVRFKATTILCKPLKAQESQCASRSN